MGNQISIDEADLLLGKLYSEGVPVVAYYVRDGVKVMRHGVIAGVSPEVGLLVADKENANKESVPLDDYLAALCILTRTTPRHLAADKLGRAVKTLPNMGPPVRDVPALSIRRRAREER